MNNSLTQYLELYEAHRADIDSHAPQALNRLRDAAFEALNKAGRLPRKGDEGYARTDIDAIFARISASTSCACLHPSTWPHRCAATCPT